MECETFWGTEKPRKESVFWVGQGYSAARYLWQLLSRAGDVESNPGPDCAECKKCTSVKGVKCMWCENHVHLGCSGLSSTLFYKGGTRWCCSLCSVASDSLHSPRSQDLCVGCGRVVRTGVSRVQCVGCRKCSHAQCTGINRYQGEHGGYTSWKCAQCRDDDTQEDTVVSEGVDGAGPPLAPDTVTEVVLESGVCFGCRKVKRRGHGVECVTCKKTVHKSCVTGISRKALEIAIRSGGWICKVCKEEEGRRRREGATKVDRSQVVGLPMDGSRGLVFMQWNCDHISAKVGELESFMMEKGVDVAAIQETKWIEEDGKPEFSDYACLMKEKRRGRRVNKWTRGGGLGLFIRKGLVGQPLPVQDIEEDTVGSMEVFGVDILRGDGSTVRVYNIYIPRCADEVVLRQLNRLQLRCTGLDTIILGDVNAHGELWDNYIARDSRGDIITDWLEDNGMAVLNNGDPTRRKRGTGALSTPDISVVHAEVVSDWEWSVHKRLSSDHFPILIKLGGARSEEERKSLFAWDWQRADWPACRGYLDALVGESDLLSVSDVKCLEQRVRDLILKAARRHIGQKGTEDE